MVHRWVFFILLGIFLLLNVFSIRYKTITFDERGHYRYGMQMWEGDPSRSTRYMDSKMPFAALNVLPRKIGQWLGLQSQSSEFPEKLSFHIRTGRYITILFSLLLAFYVYRWAKELYGPVAGLFSLFIYTFSPNIIAHSRLVTTDLYGVGMTTIAVYYFRRFVKSGGWKAAGASAVTLGVAQLAKYTSLYLYPIFGIILAARSCRKRPNVTVGSFLRFLLFFLVVSMLIINIGFLFHHSLTPLAAYEFKSDMFQLIQSRAGILRNIPLLVPYPYLNGMDWVKYNERTGASLSGGVYLLGNYNKAGDDFRGFPGYYIIGFIFKVPIGIQLLILLALANYVVNRKKFDFWQDEIFLLIPVLFFFIYFNFFYRCQIGLRHFLVVFPFLHVFCGSLCKEGVWSRFNKRGVLIALSIYVVLSVLSYFPHYIPYFNELVWDRKQASKILANADIAWGQGGWYLQQYLKRYPDAILRPEEPVAGRIIVDVNSLRRYHRERYEWLTKNFEPVDHVAYAYLVYQISVEDLARIKAEEAAALTGQK